MKTKSKKQENRWAKSVSGRAIPGSGNQPGWKGDVDSGRGVLDRDWKLECKTTAKDSYKLSLSDLVKIESQAKKVGRNPAFIVKFNDEAMYGEGNEFVFISEELFDQERFPHLMTPYYYMVDTKSRKFNKEELEKHWLDDKKMVLQFNNSKKYVILNYLDFMRMIQAV